MKIGYVFKKLKTIRYKEYYNKAKEVSEKVNKSTFYILFDMAKCAFKYGSGYMDYFEFEFYLLNKKERSTYITGRINSDIVRKYNNKEDWHVLNDKGEFNNKFKDYIGRDFVDLRSKTFRDFQEFIKNKDKIIVKPIDKSGGKGIEIIELDKNKLKNEYNVLKIYNSLIKNNQMLVEDVIKQNKELDKLYSNSVNSLRVMTFLDDKGEVHILNTILKIGNNAKVDNFSSGGMYTFVNKKGEVFVPAIDEEGKIYEKHPISGVKIVGFKVPMYEKIEKLVSEASKLVPTIRYVGWDIAITDNSLLLIEGNEYPGIFQVKPSISGIKTGLIPEYRKYMDI